MVFCFVLRCGGGGEFARDLLDARKVKSLSTAARVCLPKLPSSLLSRRRALARDSWCVVDVQQHLLFFLSVLSVLLFSSKESHIMVPIRDRGSERKAHSGLGPRFFVQKKMATVR